MDNNSAVLMSLGSLFMAGAGSLMQSHFWYAVVAALVAVGCFMLREVVKA